MPTSASQRHHRKGVVVLYHGTSSHRAGNIRRVGLTHPGGTNEWQFTLTEDRAVAKAYADYTVMRETRKGSKPKVLSVEVPEDKLDEYLYPPGEHISQTRHGDVRHRVFALRKKLPPEWVR